MIKVVIADKNKDKIENLVSQKPLNELFIKAVDYFSTIHGIYKFRENQEIRKLIVDNNDFYTYRLNASYRMLFTSYGDEKGDIYIIIIDIVSASELYNTSYLRDLQNYK